ncbi:MAG: polysaccharide biosynthesis protein [Bacteroidales bacterium]|nr:MAG: polysaccharide biosynthesis protein [Bacteroidales bacterium]
MIQPTKHTPRWIVFLIDVIICLVSIVLSYLIRFEFRISVEQIHTLRMVVPLVLFIRAFSFMAFRSYAGLIRYTSAKDAERIFLVISTSSILLFLVNFINYSGTEQFIIPNSILLIDFFITTILLVGSRLFYKTVYYTIKNTDIDKDNIIIVGVEQSAAAAKRAIDRDTISNLKVIAFIDPHNQQEGKKIEDVDIYNTYKLDYLLQKHKISKVIIAQKSLDPIKKTKIIDKCLNFDVKVQTIPDATAWINGELSLNQIKSIKIEDLLERPPIVLDKKRIQSYIKGKTVLVTGAAGSIGSEMVRQISKFYPKKIILFDQAESPLYDLELELKESLHFYEFETVIGSITNNYRVNKLFEVYKPNVVFHAAAYKHVPMMENNPTEAVFNNVSGTKLIADTAVKYGVEKFVMISTDKAVNPTNIMGASKRIAEIYTQTLNKSADTNFITTRFGNVLGSNGSVIPRFRKQIEQGGPLTITHPEVTRFFMTIPEACQLVLEAGAMGQGGEIFIFDMGKSVKILDLAKKMIKLSGLTLGKDIQINFTGLRPGEKLYEELLNNKENTIPTYHPKIMIAMVQDYQPEVVFSKINELIGQLSNHNNFRIVSLMKDIVPEFLSKNSIYEDIDRHKKFASDDQPKTA